ncbi:ATP-binding protein [Brachybacterium squillarum]|uniref:ATP-binding protein n=1 Tax=Brachybacterium squillarum TaxID=661979 RepID=UPI00026293E1|nr:ATP-binding protein [Brachybacterium squillarum]
MESDASTLALPGVADAPADEQPAATVTDPEHPHPGQWRLTHLQVSNWGTFHGTHDLAISSKGFFLTGGPGTGKSTLLDAISALLTPPRTLQFNAAASDAGPARSKYRRTVASYVRGAWAMHYDPATGEFSQEVLREKSTLSVLTLRYTDGLGGTVQLSRLLLLHAGHSADSDVKSLYVIARKPLDVTDLRRFVSTQIEGKALEAAHPGTETFRQFREYRAAFSQLLGIPDEKALSLLHKIQSAKELGDVNALLRDYMLDAPRTFELADQALANFHNLSEVHEALVTAREQRDLLRGLRENHTAWTQMRERGGELVDRRSDIDVFASQHLVRLLSGEQERLQLEGDRLQAQQRRLTQDVAEARSDLAQLKEQRRRAGGGEIDDWKQQVAGLEVERERRRERATEFAAQLATVELGTPAGEDMFLALQRDVTTMRQDLETEETGADAERWEAEAQVRELAGQLQRTREELASLTTRASNLHSEDVALRDAIAAEVGIAPTELPFAAELLQVRAGEEEWTAAAEQALRGLARSILVPDRVYRQVAAVIDRTKLRRRISYNRINTDLRRPAKQIDPRSLAANLDVKDGEFHVWLSHEVASRMDYTCAEDLDEFTRLSRAVLRSGQIKHSATRHEKSADRQINDRSQWVLGFDNRAKRAVFETERTRAEQALFEAQARRKDVETQRERRRERLYALQSISAVTWDDIDAASVARRIANLRDMVRAAEDGSAALSELARQIEDVERSIAESDEELLEVVRSAGKLTEQSERAAERLEKARAQVADKQLDPAVEAELAERFAAIAPALVLDTIDQVTKDASATLDAELMDLTRRTSRAEEDMRTAMREFARRWPAQAGDTEPTLEGAGDFLAILQGIEEEKLPEVEERFFEFFTGNTLGDVQALATAIAREPAEIRKRLQRINALLAQVEFHSGRYLQLSMRPVHLAALDEFKSALEEAVAGTALNDMSRDRDLAEERFLSLRHLMDLIGAARTRDDQVSRAILDVRRHVHFHAEEVDASGTVVHAHESGGPLSGGQNERLTTFCLAAALRYQLAGTGQDVPRYAPIIIDEAFSKGAGKFITAAMESFRHFGFQVVLANPGKNPQALAPFIGGVGVVSIRQDRYSQVAPVEFVPVPA